MTDQPWDFQQQARLERLSAKDDALRAAADRVRLVVDLGFSIHGLEEQSEGLHLNPGDHIEISAHDLQKYLGKAHVPLPGMEPAAEPLRLY